ncbi:ATP-binding cassette sub-family a member 5, partial [Plakobranchus ocellatus]
MTHIVAQVIWVRSNETQVHPESDTHIRAVKSYKGVKITGASFWQQLKASLWRNVKLKLRSGGVLAGELFTPACFVGILAVIKILSKPETKPSIVFPVNSLNSSAFGYPIHSNKVILAAPNSTQYDQFMQQVLSQLPGPPSYQMFNSSETLERHYISLQEKAKTNILAGVVFNYGNDVNAYAIRMNSEKLPSTSIAFHPNKGSCRKEKDGTDTFNCPANQYMSSGFALLQMALENVLMKNLGLSSPDPKARSLRVQMMDKKEYSPDSSSIQTTSSIYFVISFTFMVSQLTVRIVSEKEKKIKEGMMMMGLRSSAFWLSWTIVYMALVFFTTCLITIIILASNFFRQSNIFILFLAFLLYGGSFVCFAFMITPFFNKAKTAGSVAGMSTILLSCLYLAFSQTRSPNSYDSNLDPALQWVMCLLSPVAFATFTDQALFLDIHLNGFGFDDSLTYGKFPLYAPLLMLFIDIIIYSVLTFYLDKVVPGEYGVRYHPLYFLQKDYWCPGSDLDERTKLMSPSHSVAQAVDVEAMPANMHNKMAMRIASLTKTFKIKKKIIKAVDGFCLDIYEGQITCLLGHNGAGKSTLMNMLTGVVTPTCGRATVLGLEITKSSDLERIRSLCGICPQHDILYKELSCREHLRIFANIKGVPSSQIDKTIEKALQDVDLVSHSNTLAENLSGGQKRKLSVAIALIGDPKLIFLDEPTAGMDPFSRRHMWSLLKRHKEGRVILLTTHFMDEADILSDRKAFISKGKLRCCGSSLFLKNKFGVGYHLTMVAAADCEVQKVTTSLQSIIPSIQLERSHGKEISYTVPLADVGSFS